MEILNQKQVLKMKHFNSLLIFIFCTSFLWGQDCISGDCMNGFGEKKWKSSNYTGEFKEGRMHGVGTFTWVDGGNYSGDFREGFFDGEGVRNYKSGARYKGTFKYDSPHGTGLMTYKDGSSYDGQWQFGYKHGLGFYNLLNNHTYKGEYKFGNKEGSGVLTWEKGDIYQGSFKNGNRDGYGVYTWPSGTSHAGFWKLNTMHGPGSTEKEMRVIRKGIWYKGDHQASETGCLGDNNTCLPNKICCKITNEDNELYFTKTNSYTVALDQIPSFLNIYKEAKKRYYYDENWKITTKEKSKYYREYGPLDTITNSYPMKAYYSVNNQLQWTGNIRNNRPSASNCSLAICEGATTWFNQDGSLSSESFYLEGREHGKSTIYLKSGKSFEMNYDRGKYIPKD